MKYKLYRINTDKTEQTILESNVLADIKERYAKLRRSRLSGNGKKSLRVLDTVSGELINMEIKEELTV
jgi:hypothetical protein